jgi:hypothetical protein
MDVQSADVARAERDRSSRVSSSTVRAVLLAAVLGTALAYMSDDMLNLAIPPLPLATVGGSARRR